MIVITRRPVAIYDVDLVGGLLLVALVVTGIVAFGVPAQQSLKSYNALMAQVRSAEVDAGASGSELRRLQEEIEHAERLLQEQRAAAPTSGDLPGLITQVTQMARDSNLEVLQVTPQTSQPDGRLRSAEAIFVGRGESLDFVRYVAALARTTPNAAMSSFVIRAPADGGRECELTWTLRFRVLPAGETGS